MDRDASLSPRSAPLVTVKNPEPDEAVQHIETASYEETRNAVEMIEEFAIGPDVERAEQDINEIKRTKSAIEVTHVSDDKPGPDVLPLRLVTRKFDHLGAEVEPTISVSRWCHSSR